MKKEIGMNYKKIGLKENTMKARKLLFTLLALMVTVGAIGQDAPTKKMEKREKVKAMKIAFITQEVDFTEAEAQAFWPIYNKHEKNIKALRKEHKTLREKFKGKKIDDLTDAEAKELVDGEMSFKEKKLAIEKQYKTDIEAVLPIKKVLKYFKAERDFKRKLLKRMRGKRGKRKGPRGKRMGPPPGHEDMGMPPIED